MRLPAWSKSFGVQVTIALIAGVILGLIARSWGPVSDSADNWLGQTLDTIGSSYVTLLKAAVVPLVITAIIASIGNLRKVTKRVLESLIKGGACDCLGVSRAAMIATLDGVVARAQKKAKEKESNQASLLALAPPTEAAPLPGIGMVGSENTYLVTPNGGKALTGSPHKLNCIF